jgi:ubiquinone/menaquinone biosynthesis C-methylase UbiE
MSTRDRVVQANIEVHTKMIDDYESEPHWRPENIKKVSDRMQKIYPIARESALDVGAGTGFLTRHLVKDFKRVNAIDITPAMLAKIPQYDNLEVQICQVEDMPFPDETFDFVCAYSFLHHLYDPNVALKEMIRVLKPNGVLYVDLEPNAKYWANLKEISETAGITITPLVEREINATINIASQVSNQYAIEDSVFDTAEYSKSITGGFGAIELEKSLQDLGLGAIKVNLDWFMGQGGVMHGQSFQLAQEIEDYLRTALPASANLFKYLWFTGVKKEKL